MIKTMKEFKSVIKSSKEILIVENAFIPTRSGQKRKIIKAQINEFQTLLPDGTDTWISYQKAKSTRFNKDGTIDFLNSGLNQNLENENILTQDYWLKLKLEGVN